VRVLAALLLLAPLAAAETVEERFAGEVLDVEGRIATVRYDFESDRQLEDFVTFRPQGLLPGAGKARHRVADGRLVVRMVNHGVERRDIRSEIVALLTC